MIDVQNDIIIFHPRNRIRKERLLPRLAFLIIVAFLFGLIRRSSYRSAFHGCIGRIILVGFKRAQCGLGHDVRVVVREDIVDCWVVVFASMGVFNQGEEGLREDVISVCLVILLDGLRVRMRLDVGWNMLACVLICGVGWMRDLVYALWSGRRAVERLLGWMR